MTAENVIYFQKQLTTFQINVQNYFWYITEGQTILNTCDYITEFTKKSLFIIFVRIDLHKNKNMGFKYYL